MSKRLANENLLLLVAAGRGLPADVVVTEKLGLARAGWTYGHAAR